MKQNYASFLDKTAKLLPKLFSDTTPESAEKFVEKYNLTTSSKEEGSSTNIIPEEIISDLPDFTNSVENSELEEVDLHDVPSMDDNEVIDKYENISVQI